MVKLRKKGTTSKWRRSFFVINKVIKLGRQASQGREPHEIAGWSKPERDALLRQLKEKKKLSIHQIERATGISRGVIAKS